MLQLNTSNMWGLLQQIKRNDNSWDQLGQKAVVEIKFLNQQPKNQTVGKSKKKEKWVREKFLSDGSFSFVVNRSSDSESESESTHYLSASGEFIFSTKALYLSFSHPDLPWKLLGITGSYDFTSGKLRQCDFANIETGFVLNQKLKLDVSKIDRHILMKRFSFQLRYKFFDSLMVHTADCYADVRSCCVFLKYIFSLKLFTSKVPYFDKSTDMSSESLGQYFPPKEIVNLHNAKYKETSSLTLRENQLLQKLKWENILFAIF